MTFFGDGNQIDGTGSIYLLPGMTVQLVQFTGVADASMAFTLYDRPTALTGNQPNTYITATLRLQRQNQGQANERITRLILAAAFLALSAGGARAPCISGATTPGCPAAPSGSRTTPEPPRFNNPMATAVDSNGNVYVADTKNNTIRKITPGGVVTTVGSPGVAGSTDGTGSAALFNHPTGIAVTGDGSSRTRGRQLQHHPHW